jgi:small ligand-binding sensory domain FIST
MQSFFNICSQHATASAVIEDCLQQLGRAPTEANFGFLYATDAMASEYKTLLDECKARTGIEHWVGSLGIGVISSGREHYDTPAASIMLAKFDEPDFAMLPLISQPDEIKANIKTPDKFATSLAIIHGDPFNPETQNLIHELQAQIHNCFMAGGLTSSHDKQYQIADNVYSGGVSGVLFSENVGVLSNLSQGCSPVGNRHKITRTRENVIFSLDHKPALDVLMYDMGIKTAEELQTRAAEVLTGLCIPGSDKSDYTVRNLIGVDFEHKAFAINDILVEGNELLFCHRDSQTAVADMKQMLDSMAKRLHKPPLGGIYISCIGRGREQFGSNSEEIKLIQQKLGDFPLTGFFANGEIHHDKLYGYTGVLTVFTQE